MTTNLLFKHLTPGRKGILAGLLLVLLVSIGSYGVFNALYAIPQPDYSLPTLPPSHGWDFTTGIHLSSQIYDYSDKLVSFQILPGSDAGTYFKDMQILWGSIISETYPTTYLFPIDNAKYQLQFHFRTDNMFYQDVDMNVTPADLTLLNVGLIHLLANKDSFTPLTSGQYNQSIAAYFQAQPDYPSTQDRLRISHLYTDGTYVQFRILGDTVFILFSHMGQLVFSQPARGMYTITHEINNTDAKYFSIGINNFNLQKYVDCVNYLWYSIKR